MKFKMAKNSVFAVLLRSPWWISTVIAAGIVIAAGGLLPALYVPFGMMAGLPFLVIGFITAWRQWQAPDPVRLSAALARAGAMSWRDFSNALEQAFGRQGYVVTRLNSPAADFQLTRNGATTLVSCKRWKAANHGVDGLRDLAVEQQAQAAQHGTYISLASVTDKAQRYAKEQGIRLMTPAELGQLMLEAS